MLKILNKLDDDCSLLILYFINNPNIFGFYEFSFHLRNSFFRWNWYIFVHVCRVDCISLITKCLNFQFFQLAMEFFRDRWSLAERMMREFEVFNFLVWAEAIFDFFILFLLFLNSMKFQIWIQEKFSSLFFAPVQIQYIRITNKNSNICRDFWTPLQLEIVFYEIENQLLAK